MPANLDEARQKALDDPYYFIKRVVGADRMVPYPHRELLDFMFKTDHTTRVILMPRGSFKSTVLTVGSVIWEIIKNPNIRILIAHETQRSAIRYVKEIKTHFEQNPKLRVLFGDYVSKDTTWKDSEFIVSKRTKTKKEPTVMSASLEKGTIVGLHFDLIILDDVVSMNNINSQDQLDKTLNYYRMLLSILDPGARMHVVGTRYHVHDLYSNFYEEEFSDGVGMFVKDSMDDLGNPTMPSILNKEFLDKQRRVQGDEIFFKQYRNKALTESNAAFNRDTFRCYEELPDNLIYFMAVDPAISERKGSDPTGICLAGVDHEHNIHVIRSEEWRLPPSEVVNNIFEAIIPYLDRFMALGLEKYALERFLKHALNEEMQKRGVFFPIKDIGINNKQSKETRIKALEPLFSAGRIRWKKEHVQLIDQTINYPQVKHDDLLDALKTIPMISFPSPHKPTKTSDSSKKLSNNEKRIWDNMRKINKRKIHRKGNMGLFK